MDQGSLTLVFDVLIILFGSGISVNAIIQLLIELRVKGVDGARTHSGSRLIRHLLFLVLGISAILLRIWYIVLR